MRVLLDENLPREFAAEIVSHDVVTVGDLGWAGLKNGALMRHAADACDVFVTMDRNLPKQQHIPELPFGVILIRAPSNRIDDLVLIVGEVHAAILTVEPGQLIQVGNRADR